LFPRWLRPDRIRLRANGTKIARARNPSGFDQVFSEALQCRLVAEELRRLIVDQQYIKMGSLVMMPRPTGEAISVAKPSSETVVAGEGTKALNASMSD
jgi:hypothetical protein